MTNPFEEFHNNKRKDESDHNEQHASDTTEAINALNKMKEEIEALENLNEENDETVEEDEDNTPRLKSPPPVSTYLLFTYFPIVILSVIALVLLNQTGYPVIVYFTGGIILGYALKFSLQFLFKKIFVEPYVDKYLHPFFSKTYGDILDRKDLISLIQRTVKLFRKAYVDGDRLKTVSSFKKDGVEYTMIAGISEDKEVGIALTRNDEPVDSAANVFAQKQVHKLLINGFTVFWDRDLGVPSEFSSMSEDGVFKGTIIFESEQEAKEFAKTQDTLEEESVMEAKTRGEMFRYLETSSKVGLDTMIIMKDGTRFVATGDALYNEFQNTKNR